MRQPVIKINEILDDEWRICYGGLFANVYKPPKGPSITIPTVIEITESFAWTIGFFLAEGTKCSYCIGASNSNFALIKMFQESINKTLFTENSEWRIYIKTSKKKRDALKQKWIRRTENNNVVINYAPLATKDNIEIRINNTLLAIVFNRLVKRSVGHILSKRSLTLAFLRGYEVGDGSIIQRGGYLYGISITVKNPDIKNTLLKALENIYGIMPRVRTNKNTYEISCTGVNLMTEFILDKHFYDAKKQWKKLVTCYLKKQYTRSHLKYWSVLGDKKLSVKELLSKTERSLWSTRDAMNKDKTLGLVKIEKEKTPGGGAHHHTYSLTYKGRQLLNIIGGV